MQSSSGKPRLIRVVAAVIQRDDRFLVAQRPPGKHMAGKWEFPGGKLEPGESPEHALLREIHEELGCRLEGLRVLPSFPHAYGDLHLEMIPMLARIAADSPEPHPHEHSELRWVSLNEMGQLDLAEADWPIVRHLQAREP